jgi:hypothetical protein
MSSSFCAVGSEPGPVVELGAVCVGFVRVVGVVSGECPIGGVPAAAAPVVKALCPLVATPHGEHAGRGAAAGQQHREVLLLPSRLEPAGPGGVFGERGEVRTVKRRCRQPLFNYALDQRQRVSGPVTAGTVLPHGLEHGPADLRHCSGNVAVGPVPVGLHAVRHLSQRADELPRRHL